MRGLLWLIALFAAAVGVAVLARANDGYALLVLSPYRVQISLNLLVLALLATFLAAYFVLRVITRAVRLPGQVVAYRGRRRKEKSAVALREALRLHLEGRYSQALKQAKKAYDQADDDGVAALMAARAAHALRDDTRYREWLGKAAQDERLRAARIMTEAEMAVEGRRFDEAAERIRSLKGSDNRPVATLRLALKTAHALENWEELIRIARQLRKHRALSQEQAAPLLRRAHLAALRERDGQQEAIARYWQGIPADEQQDRRLVEKAVPLLVANGQGATVRKMLERLLDEQWESDLARLYGHCGEDDAVACLNRAEKWLKAHPDDGGLLYALGRLCLSAQLWGKAQSYLEASVSVAPTVDAHLALAQLSERFERPQEAQTHFRRAAQLNGAALGAPTLAQLPAPE
ncbi:heme biosynthesis HemY N-terminal domain-containing protein [Denitromonas iodatirespirans]|uniref:Heme biosynthesis protein HemY n=1 Tax=Denitromonas iodatirespirans TaxID=2795389 RepID=A0A944HAX8_DENI1|nr:heme biosynthesis HemY N-terminal domain-containing protein [Denitromonas iodatirespirans]MBT0963940.1 heme biosynthesis protein HemY [Denitromonas iodatirespirans]